MATVKFATIGSNFITDRFLDACAQIAGVELVAIYSRTAERAAEFAAKHSFDGPTFTDLDALAKVEEVDAIYIASPTSEHAWQAIKMLQAGKHVLCEKPVCSNANELEAVLAAAEASGKAFMEAMRSLKTPNFSRAAAELATLGPCRHFHG
eukprot:SAG31_NODE_710_length_12681_cov_5.880277_1_plen_151_part_00